MASAEEVAAIFPQMADSFDPDKAGDLNASIQFDLSGDNGGMYWVKVADGAIETGEGAVDTPNMTLKAAADDWHAVSTGQLNAMQAFMTGKIKIQGDMSLAMKLQTMFNP